MDGLRRGVHATPADVLRLAQRLMWRGGWSPNAPALSPQAKPVAQLDNRAWSFSVIGAIGRARFELGAPWLIGVRAGVLFTVAVGAGEHDCTTLRRWECAPERTGEDIDAGFARAIAAADNPLSKAPVGVLLNAVA